MTDQAMSPLRRRMIEDMTVRNFVAKTQIDYIRRVKNFAVFLGRSPDTATREDVRRYLLHLASSGMGAGTVNGTGSALRFLFDITLDRPDVVRHLPVAREPRKAPVILSPEEVARMLEAAPGVKYKAALSVAYGAGLRVSEVVALKVGDIDSARMMIRIEQSKRRKDRYAMLSPRLLDLLRDWWLICRSRGWLFPGRDPLQPITTRQLIPPSPTTPAAIGIAQNAKARRQSGGSPSGRPPAPTTSRSPANCSPPQGSKANLPRPMLPIPTSRHVHAAAVA
jgi:integrase